MINRALLNEAMVDKRLGESNLFFLLGSGRCGTLLISRMLNKDPKVVALHEPHRHCDLSARPDCRRSAAYANQYVRRFRKYEIYKKLLEKNVQAYGEVSSPLRCLGGALRASLPNAHFFILVRDGRSTVRSAMNRQAPKDGKTNHVPTQPLKDDHPYFEKWDELSEFERACWWWMDSYRMLQQQLPDAPIVHFDRLVKEYDYLRENVLEPANIELSPTEYQASLDRKSANAAREYSIPHWDEWDDQLRTQFDAICGETMERMGFERHW